MTGNPTGAAMLHSASGPTLLSWLRGLMGHAWFAYLTILLLQTKVVWQAWTYRDLTTGDTSGYYLDAWKWHEARHNVICWSPLYTSFYGTVLDIVPDPIVATLVHRLLIVFAATTMVLALFRKLFTPGLAWMTAAWWAVLPINFNTLYEVHLFAVLPILSAWLVAATYRNAWGRGATLGILAASTILVRNELSVACGLWATVCLAIEGRAWWKGELTLPRGAMKRFAAYMLPLLIVAPLTLLYYSRSTSKFSNDLDWAMKGKHTLNMAQVYCFGYSQRHPEYKDSPWVGYQPLMTQTFGKDLPTLREMIAANPSAVADHFAWNFSMAPNGLQVLLFNATTWERNPDYPPVHVKSRTATVLTGVLLAIWFLGLVAILRDPRTWWETCIQGRGQVWLAMLCVAAVSLVVIPTQRPRPSYLFALSITLMGVTAACLQLLALRIPTMTRTLGSLVPIAAVVLIALAPSYYKSRAIRQWGTPLADRIRSLQPYKDLIARKGAVLVTSEYPFETMSYLTNQRCVIHGREFLQDWDASTPLDRYLTERGVTFLLLDQTLLDWLRGMNAQGAKMFLESRGNEEWKLLGTQNIPRKEWKLFMRGPGVPPPGKLNFLDVNVYTAAEVVGVAADAWVGKSCGWTLTPQPEGKILTIRGTIPQIEDPEFNVNATVEINGIVGEPHTLGIGDFELRIPVATESKLLHVKLSFDRLQQLPNGDGRHMAARLYSADLVNR